MREYKFRAFGKNIKEYLSEDGVEPYQYTLKDISNGCIYDIDSFIIEQSTGLLDRNGKEIYDGDIIEQFVCGVRQYKGKKCGRSTTWLVRWNQSECCFELHRLKGALFGDSMMSDDDEYEVIGNVHETPELIGDEE